MNTFSERLLTWFDTHGRHNLPWQGSGVYGVWVSEIMLQQTQVATMLPYYEKFMRRFPSINALATAPLDDVLAHWAGLGYYNRARNLQRAAQQICDEYDGQFPQQYDDVLALPGIGPSTAGAILAQAFDQQHSILDGNVKRVLARYYGITSWPGQTQTQQLLWQKAKNLTPKQRVADYTQAIMDLGATVCSRSKPNCIACPVNVGCIAFEQNLTASIPASKPKKAKPNKYTEMYILYRDGEVLLEKRPPLGIWPSLWSLPESGHNEVDTENTATDSKKLLQSSSKCKELLQQHALKLIKLEPLSPLRHTFSHYHLNITPILVHVCQNNDNADSDFGLHQIKESNLTEWAALNTLISSDDDNAAAKPALPAPVQKLLCNTGIAEA